MKFRSFTGQDSPEQEVQQDFERAVKQENVRLGDTFLFLNHMLYTEYLPYAAITRAFRRIEEVNGRLCCGNTSYEIHEVAIEAAARSAVLRFQTREAAVACLEKIAAKSEQAEIGYHPEKKN